MLSPDSWSQQAHARCTVQQVQHACVVARRASRCARGRLFMSTNSAAACEGVQAARCACESPKPLAHRLARSAAAARKLQLQVSKSRRLSPSSALARPVGLADPAAPAPAALLQPRDSVGRIGHSEAQKCLSALESNSPAARVRERRMLRRRWSSGSWGGCFRSCVAHGRGAARTYGAVSSLKQVGRILYQILYTMYHFLIRG